MMTCLQPELLMFQRTNHKPRGWFFIIYQSKLGLSCGLLALISFLLAAASRVAHRPLTRGTSLKSGPDQCPARGNRSLEATILFL